jgi:hypothetical protein
MFPNSKSTCTVMNTGLQYGRAVLPRLVIAASLTLLVGVRSLAGETDEAERLRTVRSDYAKGLAELRTRLAAVRGSGTYTDSRRAATAIRSYDVEFSRKPGSFKYIVRNHWFAGNGARTPNNDSAVCSSPLTNFSLGKRGGESAFHVSRVAEAPFTIAASAPLPKFLDCAFSLGNYSLPDLLAAADFELTKVEEQTIAAKRTCKLFFLRPLLPDPKSNKPQALADGWIIVSPQDHWATQQYEFRHATFTKAGQALISPFITSGLVEYGNSAEGAPLPRRAEIKTFIRVAGLEREVRLGAGLHDGDVTQVESFDFKSIEMVADPDNAFTMNAFGLPKLDRGQ